jgi:hypothetical protein
MLFFGLALVYVQVRSGYAFNRGFPLILRADDPDLFWWGVVTSGVIMSGLGLFAIIVTWD